MLAKYHHWVFENRKQESVETLWYWVIQEAEFQTIAAETIRGLTLKDSSKFSEVKKKELSLQFLLMTSLVLGSYIRENKSSNLYASTVVGLMAYGIVLTFKN